MNQPKKTFNWEIQISFTTDQATGKGPLPLTYDHLNTLPQVQYLRDGHYRIDFGVQQLYISDVSAILVLRHEEEVPEEVPVVKLNTQKETK